MSTEKRTRLNLLVIASSFLQFSAPVINGAATNIPLPRKLIARRKRYHL
jgi:hypothetical protein